MPQPCSLALLAKALLALVAPLALLALLALFAKASVRTHQPAATRLILPVRRSYHVPALRVPCM